MTMVKQDFGVGSREIVGQVGGRAPPGEEAGQETEGGEGKEKLARSRLSRPGR